MITDNGKNLIFLISQPRAGSTMTQKILGAHPDIHTTSEPWLMLPPIYAMKEYGSEAEYSTDLARIGIREFINEMSGGESEYLDKMRIFYASLYDSVLSKTGKSIYLDKTPRYYLITNELMKLYPGAKFVLLIRNPLAVLASIIKTWIKGDWFKLSSHRHDLLTAPLCILDAMRSDSIAPYLLSYEKTINDPHGEICKLCDYLEINFIPEMINYGNNDGTKWRLGDQDCVYEKKAPDKEHLDKWTECLSDPQSWRIMHEYLNALGRSVFESMGYDFDLLVSTVEKAKPDSYSERNTISMISLMENAHDFLIENKRLKAEISAERAKHQSVVSKKDEQIAKQNETVKTQLIQRDEWLKQKDEKIRERDEWLKQKDSRILSITAEKDRIANQKDELLRLKDDKICQWEEWFKQKDEQRVAQLAQKDEKIRQWEEWFKQKDEHLVVQLAQKDEVIARKDAVIAQKDGLIIEKDEVVRMQNAKIELSEERIRRLYACYPYRIGKFLLFPAEAAAKILKKILHR